MEIEDQIYQFKETFGEEVPEDTASPAARHLLMINKNAEKLLKDESETFHPVTAKFIFILKRVRADLEPTVDLLCTRVTKSGKGE